MNGNLVITIGRECGSAGRLIGKMLAERLGVKFYDKELLTLAAKQSGMCKELFESHDEKPTNSFLYSLVMDTYSMGYTTSSFMDMPLNHKVFLAQFDTIKKLALEESCVIVGRCADYALAEYPSMISVFISGNEEDKIRHFAEAQNVTPEKAKDIIAKTDKKRANYYNYYSNKKWGDAKSYHLCVNSSITGYEGAVDLILEFIRIKEKNLGTKKG
ncbi:cytidylate kinase-like family protein [Cuneatibacter caecimuris]|uniref:Cytidylate kinase n=1 Tax=Cuneatibacter caecimuris TaxID=1796618 RepID=A0A4Q7NZK8_9FIRM|nr:cytidylate kinase-like family protein [Cuneatibacter caecimuris]RZS92921.1 cytidylate kinase [Cuneatibacter caecimuris]